MKVITVIQSNKNYTFSFNCNFEIVANKNKKMGDLTNNLNKELWKVKVLKIRILFSSTAQFSIFNK